MALSYVHSPRPVLCSSQIYSNMAFATIVTLALLFQHLEAAPSLASTRDRPCVDFMLPVSVTAQNAVYDVLQVEDNINATAFGVDLDTWSSPMGSDRILRNITVSNTFDISAQLCIPSNGTKKEHLQIATHGILFDKRYWDVSINPAEYSYVDAVLEAGYSILTYDRLGVGLSDKPDAYTVVQAPLELEILRSITQMARNGKILDHVAGTMNGTAINGSTQSFDKIIHVGHSFGSLLTTALLATYGDLSDAAVITGYVLNDHIMDVRYSELGLTYAAQNDPAIFGDRPSGYIVSGTPSAVQTGFFSTRANTTTGLGGFDPELLDYAFSTRQPFTASEMISAPEVKSATTSVVATDFKGPLQFVVAEFDFLLCRADCDGAFHPAAIEPLYPNAKDVDFYTQPGSGHGLTMHRGANLGYKAIFDYLGRNGL